MGRGGDGLKRRGRAQTAQARTRGCREGLGTGMGQGGQEDRLAEADAAAGVRGSASAVGGGAHLLLVRAEQEDEQGLRERLCESAEAFVYAAMIRLMVRRLARG